MFIFVAQGEKQREIEREKEKEKEERQARKGRKKNSLDPFERQLGESESDLLQIVDFVVA